MSNSSTSSSKNNQNNCGSPKKDAALFIFKGAALLAAFFLILSIFNYLYVTEVNPRRNIYKTTEQFTQANPTVLFVGDSHTASAVHPDFIPGAFNFANAGETLEGTYYRLRSVLRERPIETLVMQIDPHTFSNYKVEPFSYTWFWTQYVSYDELSSLTGKNKPRLFVENTFPVIGRGEDFFTVALRNKSTTIVSGHHVHVEKWTDEENKVYEAEKRARFHFNDFDGIDKHLLEHFIMILELSKELGIDVVLVKYPLTEEYITAISPYVDQEKLYQQLDQEVEIYNVTILDYQTIFTDADLFSDEDHLNEDGSARFSTMLSERLFPTQEQI